MKNVVLIAIALAIGTLGAYKFAFKKPTERKIVIVLNPETYTTRETLNSISIASPFGRSATKIDPENPVVEIPLRGQVVRLAEQFPKDRTLYCRLLGEDSKVLSIETDSGSVPAEEKHFWRNTAIDQFNDRYTAITIAYGTASIAQQTFDERASRMKH